MTTQDPTNTPPLAPPGPTQVETPAAAPALEVVTPASTPPVDKPIPEKGAETTAELGSATDETPKPEDKKAEAPGFKPHTETPTLLQKTEAGKDQAKTEETKADGGKPADQIAPAYEFRLPEGWQPDTEQMGAYTGLLAKHSISPEVGQELVDLHAAAMRGYTEHLAQEQHRVFSETRQGWVREIMADPDLGGAGHQTAASAVARMRDLLVPEKDRDAFDQFLVVTGAGDHPAFWRLLHHAARIFDEPSLPPANVKPAPSNGRPAGRSARMRDFYDHPTSQRLFR